MKKLIIILSVFLAFASCTKNLEELNKNTKDPYNVSGESLFTGGQKALIDQMTTPNVNFNIFRMFAQQWTETTYTDESNYDLVTRTIPDNHWDVMYRDVLQDFKQAKINITNTTYLSTENPAVKTNKLAIIEIMSVYAWSNLVETFGNIPYSEALDINKVTPKYDDALTVYLDLFARLNAAVATMDPNYESFGDADRMYFGDVTNWIRFANSLKLRMAMNLSNAPGQEAFAKQQAEQAAAGPIISSNAENASITYLSAQPNANPIYDNLVASGRNDFVPANTLVDTMNFLNDPRREFYFTLVDTSTSGTPSLAYVGGEYGNSNDYTQYSHVADRIKEQTFPAMLFDYAETEFLLAEAAEKGFSVPGTAEEHYNNGVTASITYWGGTADTAAAYLAQPDVAYATAPGPWQRKIGTQEWIALYNRGYEAWTAQRRLDYPQLQAPPDALSGYPVRFTYPIEEQTLNGANYQQASAAIGGDVVETHLFWDPATGGGKKK